MPHTYPSPALRREHSRLFHRPPVPLSAGAHIPAPPVPSPNSSRYLTANQQARILSWRSTTSVADVPSPTSSKQPSTSAKVKSAPASLDLPTPCSQCAANCTICSCSSGSAEPSQPSPKRRARGYYSNKKKRSAITAGGGTNASTPGPVTPSSPLSNLQGVPSPLHVHAHAAGPSLLGQYGQYPVGREGTEHVTSVLKEPPRIAGARDPISQNYYRQRFPPPPAPHLTFPPGTFPPVTFWMPTPRPW